MKCIIVDDEPFAIDLLRSYVEKTDSLELAGCFSNPVKAHSFLINNRVDLIFLDINMPELTGIQLIKSLTHSPLIIFTTAYAQYGAESYEYNAADYLLKPIRYDRFLKAVNRASETLSKASEPVSASKPLTFNNVNTAVTSAADERVVNIKSGSKVHRVGVSSILYIEASGNYMIFHTGQEKILSLMTMKEAFELLPKEQFIRIHKSFIVSLAAIEVVERTQVSVKGAKIPVGTIYREQLLERL
jgi:DNA-binding LytR/AlgR family response regulator